MQADTQSDTRADARREWMSLLAKSPAKTLASLWAAYDRQPEHAVLRAPKIGSVMVRGRAGAQGAAFNLGEITVTRCSIRLADGTVGHGNVQGRDTSKVVRAALVDALMQTGLADEVEATVLSPLRDHMATTIASRAAKAAATKVDFFTMVRGDT